MYWTLSVHALASNANLGSPFETGGSCERSSAQATRPKQMSCEVARADLEEIASEDDLDAAERLGLFP